MTVCHSRTRDLAAVCRAPTSSSPPSARRGSSRAEMVKPGATVIDVGTNRTDDGLVGDVDFESVAEVAGAITPGARRGRADDDRDAARQHAARGARASAT